MVENLVTDVLMRIATPLLFRHVRERSTIDNNVVHKGDIIIYLMYLLRFQKEDGLIGRNRRVRYCFLACCGSSLLVYLLETCVLYSQFYSGPRPTSHRLDKRIEVEHSDKR